MMNAVIPFDPAVMSVFA